MPGLLFNNKTSSIYLEAVFVLVIKYLIIGHKLR
jgi:hypothetical protein